MGTDRMKAVLYPWYEERMLDSVKRHEDIPGGFSNINVKPMDKLNMDHAVLLTIQDEMRAVLEWWTGMLLHHMATFGVRIYRRDSMLINHLDRQETHIASAVIQVGQKVDEDGAWPLEVYHPHKPGLSEVYLQPG